MKNLICVVVLITFVISCNKGDDAEQNNSKNNILLYSELKWDALNPARGDNSPKAANLWGDRNTKNATGFLVKFKEGFSSPPHIHNVTYRAIVLEGLIRNNGPKAEKNWMTVGSYWTQESGESHITEAKAENNIAYVEIDSGPYLVEPISNAYDNGNNSLNINSSNLVWLDNTESKIIKGNSGVEISNLWQNKENNTYGVFIRIPPKYDGMLKSSGSELLSLIVEGEIFYMQSDKAGQIKLNKGSLFFADDKSRHQIKNTTDENSIIYIRTNGSIRID